MGLLERFKQSKNDDVNLPLSDTMGDDPFSDDSSTSDLPGDSFDTQDSPQPSNFDDFDTQTNTDPGFSSKTSDDGLHQDVKLILERLDTIKSQLQTVQHRLDNLEKKSSNAKSW